MVTLLRSKGRQLFHPTKCALLSLCYLVVVCVHNRGVQQHFRQCKTDSQFLFWSWKNLLGLMFLWLQWLISWLKYDFKMGWRKHSLILINSWSNCEWLRSGFEVSSEHALRFMAWPLIHNDVWSHPITQRSDFKDHEVPKLKLQLSIIIQE